MAVLTRDQKLAVAAALQEKARRELLSFVMWTKPDYLPGWFHHVVCEKLDKFLQDVLDKKSPRLMLFAPPRHGKSELVSRRFPAFAFGRNPDLRMIATSYGADLSSSMNRDVQRIIDTPEYHELFPETTLSGKSVRTVTSGGSYQRNSENFEIVGRRPGCGVYRSAGVGGPITGKGGDIVIIDDPIKDAQEAYSTTTRESIWNWYTTTLRTRIEPGGGILIILTRWHEDDLAGRLVKLMDHKGEQFQIIRFPAIAEEDEEYRRAGEALHPERYSIKDLDDLRHGTADVDGVGSRVWSALFQQRPSIAEGAIFRRDAWKYFDPIPSGMLIDADRHKAMLDYYEIEQIVQYWDTAAGAKQHNDYCACVTLGVAKNRYLVLDVFKAKMEFPELKRAVKQLHQKWKPARVAVEGGGSATGKAVIQELSRETRIPLVEIVHSSDKVLRANVVSPIHEAGKVYIPSDAPWAADFIDSCGTFPNAKNDDDVDAFMGALETALQRRGPMKISDNFLERIG